VTAVLPVLMYHSVPPSGLGDRLAVPRPMVDRQWRVLRADGWNLRGLTEVLALARANPGARTISVTFDDGYADFIGVAELLSAHNARGDAELGIAALWKGLEVTALDGTTIELSAATCSRTRPGLPATGPGRCCGSRRTCTPRPAGGSLPPSAATTTGRTRWPTSWMGPSRRVCSTSPTAGSSPWTEITKSNLPQWDKAPES
jgi:hypothetical protein